MPERVFIGVAWPYANGSLHLGHLAGCYLAADIFARFNRLIGNEVLMVSGSDSHGTPITIRADQENVTPKEIADRFHNQFLTTWDQLGITFDLFTNTQTENHQQAVHKIFTILLDKGYIYPETMELAHCSGCSRFLPDRYVEGTCPHCHQERARGDQCDLCGRTLDPKDLVSPQCTLCGLAPTFQNSEHFFLKLSEFQQPLLDWVNQQNHWRPNVVNFTRSFLESGLKDRAITRDLSWGVPVPVDGYDDKRIYVWFEAVIGYLSAAIEWAQNSNQPDRWKDFWQDSTTKSYYFIGKDNIPFHSIIWPAIIMGYGNHLNLPYDVPANEFLSLENRKFSTSQNWAVWLPDYLASYDPDPLRYLLSINMPEHGDADFSWAEFVRKNNDELVATYGNLVHRVLSFTYRNFSQVVPVPGTLTTADTQLLDTTLEIMDQVSNSLSHTRFKIALSQAFSLAQETNRYLDAQAPWQTIKTDLQRTATILNTSLKVLNCLKVILTPFLPFSSQCLHEYLGFDYHIDNDPWDFTYLVDAIRPGARLEQPKPLFIKLDDELIEKETAKLGLHNT